MAKRMQLVEQVTVGVVVLLVVKWLTDKPKRVRPTVGRALPRYDQTDEYLY